MAGKHASAVKIRSMMIATSAPRGTTESLAATPKAIMSTLGPVTYSRARYRHGTSRTSFVPVDESLGLVNDFLTRPAAGSG